MWSAGLSLNQLQLLEASSLFSCAPCPVRALPPPICGHERKILSSNKSSPQLGCDVFFTSRMLPLLAAVSLTLILCHTHTGQ